MAFILHVYPAVGGKPVAEELAADHFAGRAHRLAQSGEIVGAAFPGDVGRLIFVAADVEIITRHDGETPEGPLLSLLRRRLHKRASGGRGRG